MKISFTLAAVPITKKNHGTITSFGKPCRCCGVRPHHRLIPSQQFTDFEKVCIHESTEIRSAIAATGRVKLPITSNVSVAALIYRDANVGDWNGYTDAIADVLQEPTYRIPCGNPKCTSGKVVTLAELRSVNQVTCGKCKETFRPNPIRATEKRKGMGVILDDKLIRDWDGTRLMKDSKDPRIELTITTLTEGLFDE